MKAYDMTVNEFFSDKLLYYSERIYFVSFKSELKTSHEVYISFK